MGTDVTVDLKQMERMAESINNRAANLRIKFANMLDDVKDMQKYWKGESYAKFATTVNNTIPTLDKMVKYFGVSLPKEIIAKRNQYAKSMQMAEVSAEKNQNIFELTKLTIANQGTEIKFNSAGMASLTSKIDQRFENILNTNLVNIKEDFNSITWKGDTGKKLKTKFREYMDETISAVNKIRKAYRNALEAQAKAMDKAETGNATSGATADVSTLNTQAQAAENQADTLKGQNYDWQTLGMK